MISRLSTFGRLQLKIVNKSCVLLQNHSNNKLFKVSSRFIFSGDESNQSNYEYMDNIPNIPEPVINETILNAIGEPSFASIGLNNYTPVGLVQCILENIHVNFGLPWWGCILLTSVLIKTAMIPVIINQRRSFILLQNNTTRRSVIMQEAFKARQSGNSLLMVEKIREFERVINTEKLDLLSVYKPILIQAPIFISVFYALRGMSNVPVASLATGGLWWFTDLTVCDPYYILPLITAGSILMIFELGAEMPAVSGVKLKTVIRCLAPVMFLCVSQFSSTILLYWTCSNLYSLVFSQIMKLPSVIKYIKLPDVLPLPVQEGGFKGGLKETMAMIKSMQEVVVRDNVYKENWERKEQKEILERGLAAASIRKKMKESMKERERKSVNVVGELVEDEKKENKI